jgi:ABC-type multidrug transport system permease subunit
MNKNQWFVFAIIFSLLATNFGISSLMVSPGFQDIGTIIWAVGRIYAMATWFCFAFSGICFFCGLLEWNEERKALLGKRKI